MANTRQEALVHEALHVAVYENDYVEMLGWDAEHIADDLMDYDAGCERLDRDDVIVHVRSWLAAHKRA